MFFAERNDAAQRGMGETGESRELRAGVLGNLVGTGVSTHLSRSWGDSPAVTGEARACTPVHGGGCGVAQEVKPQLGVRGGGRCAIEEGEWSLRRSV